MLKNKFIIYLAIYFVLAFVTGIFMKYFKFLGAAPEFFLIFLTVFSILRGSRFGVVFGFFSGLFMDFASIFLVGSQSLIFTTVGYVSGIFSKKLYLQFFHYQVIIISVVTIVRWGLNFFLGAVFGVKYSPSLKWMVLTLVYNMLITPLAFRIAENINDKTKNKNRE